MTHEELVRFIAADNDLSISQARHLLNSLLSKVVRVLRHGEQVALPQFGRFRVVAKKARQGRNPKTGEVLTIPAQRTVRFKPSRQLRQVLNP